MATWEFIPRVSVAKNLVVRKTVSRTAGVYGVTKVFDMESPELTIHLETGEGLTEAEHQALLTLALTPDGTTSVVDNAGVTRAGRILNYDADRPAGTDRYKASLTLRPQDDET